MRKRLALLFLLLAILLTGLFALTWWSLQPFPASLSFVESDVRKVQVLDRHRQPLTITYQNQWNIHDYQPLHDIPQRLQYLFVLAEDQRFYQHSGPDWRARIHAGWQNVLARRVVRGASTITEQCVRMLHPRPRTPWSRWVEGFEATMLEQQFSKAEILEFYLNQVPYSHQRRGVTQAARYYFDRDLDTLSLREMLALAVLVRSPSRLDLRQGNKDIQTPIRVLGQRLVQTGMVSRVELAEALAQPMPLREAELPVQATHFVHYLYSTLADNNPRPAGGRLHTTLDAGLQQGIQTILDNRLTKLAARNVHHAAALVVDNANGEILAWVNSGRFADNQIDAVTAARQPGSTLKPFVYALALEKGWTAATLVEDSPLSEAVGTGLHSYRNYSRTHYGLLRVRDALGNSLNIPAVRAAQFTGVADLLAFLHQLGFASLAAHPDYYGDGLALGNGEVTLLELTQAYATLARQGQWQPLRMLAAQGQGEVQAVLSAEIASLIGNILADADARSLEFGAGDLLRFPVQTAVKTGTSTDYRDAWAMGFNHRYTVGVWMGNVDQTPMSGVSGAIGPALVLRGIFAELERDGAAKPLWLSTKLAKLDICRSTGLPAHAGCAARPEWFIPGTEPSALRTAPPAPEPLRLRQPANGMFMALDPRIPDELEAFPLRLNQAVNGTVEWWVDGQLVGVTPGTASGFSWPMTRGEHVAWAKIRDSAHVAETGKVAFMVK